MEEQMKKHNNVDQQSVNKAICVSRESLVLLELLVPLDTRDLVACLVSVELLDPLESRERR